VTAPPDPTRAALPPPEAVPLLTPGRCGYCREELNERGFCLACYERVAREKPLELWVKYGAPVKKCKHCGRDFTPAARNYIHCPDCWAEVGQEYLKKRYGKNKA
jgi:predicted amidophosphoribosyltransferase